MKPHDPGVITDADGTKLWPAEVQPNGRIKVDIRCFANHRLEMDPKWLMPGTVFPTREVGGKLYVEQAEETSPLDVS